MCEREGGRERVCVCEREGGRERERGRESGRDRGRERERESWIMPGQGHSVKAQLEREEKPGALPIRHLKESAVQHPRVYPHITQCYAFAVRYYIT